MSVNGFRPGTDANPRFGAGCSQAMVSLQARKGGNIEMEAYCLKCRTKREMRNPQQVTMKNGKPATKGSCPTCGTQMYRIGKA